MENATTIRTVTFRVLPGSRARARDLPVSPVPAGSLGIRFSPTKRTCTALRAWWAQCPRPCRSHALQGVHGASAGYAVAPRASVRRGSPHAQAAGGRVAGALQGQSGRPRFKSRHKGGDGFTIPQDVRFDGDYITIPKLGKVGLRRRGGNPHAAGEARTATFTRRCGSGTASSPTPLPRLYAALMGEQSVWT